VALVSHKSWDLHKTSKKENLSDWFFEKRIEGEPISRNIAKSMATLIRLPTAQRGGAKRTPKP
jgi:hypothetical protein